MRLTDVRLLVGRFEECLRFYTEVLGLQPKLRIPEGTYAEVEAGDVVLSLYQRRLMDEVVGAEQDEEAPRTDRAALVFAVDDVDATLEALRERGADIVTEAHDQEAWGLRVAHVRHPEGNLIEIYRHLR